MSKFNECIKSEQLFQIYGPQIYQSIKANDKREIKNLIDQVKQTIKDTKKDFKTKFLAVRLLRECFLTKNEEIIQYTSTKMLHNLVGIATNSIITTASLANIKGIKKNSNKNIYVDSLTQTAFTEYIIQCIFDWSEMFPTEKGSTKPSAYRKALKELINKKVKLPTQMSESISYFESQPTRQSLLPTSVNSRILPQDKQQARWVEAGKAFVQQMEQLEFLFYDPSQTESEIVSLCSFIMNDMIDIQNTLVNDIDRLEQCKQQEPELAKKIAKNLEILPKVESLLQQLEQRKITEESFRAQIEKAYGKEMKSSTKLKKQQSLDSNINQPPQQQQKLQTQPQQKSQTPAQQLQTSLTPGQFETAFASQGIQKQSSGQFEDFAKGFDESDLFAQFASKSQPQPEPFGAGFQANNVQDPFGGFSQNAGFQTKSQDVFGFPNQAQNDFDIQFSAKTPPPDPFDTGFSKQFSEKSPDQFNVDFGQFKQPSLEQPFEVGFNTMGFSNFLPEADKQKDIFAQQEIFEQPKQAKEENVFEQNQFEMKRQESADQFFGQPQRSPEFFKTQGFGQEIQREEEFDPTAMFWSQQPIDFKYKQDGLSQMQQEFFTEEQSKQLATSSPKLKNKVILEDPQNEVTVSPQGQKLNPFDMQEEKEPDIKLEFEDFFGVDSAQRSEASSHISGKITPMEVLPQIQNQNDIAIINPLDFIIKQGPIQTQKEIPLSTQFELTQQQPVQVTIPKPENQKTKFLDLFDKSEDEIIQHPFNLNIIPQTNFELEKQSSTQQNLPTPLAGQVNMMKKQSFTDSNQDFSNNKFDDWFKQTSPEVKTTLQINNQEIKTPSQATPQEKEFGFDDFEDFGNEDFEKSVGEDSQKQFENIMGIGAPSGRHEDLISQASRTIGDLDDLMKHDSHQQKHQMSSEISQEINPQMLNSSPFQPVPASEIGQYLDHNVNPLERQLYQTQVETPFTDYPFLDQLSPKGIQFKEDTRKSHNPFDFDDDIQETDTKEIFNIMDFLDEQIKPKGKTVMPSIPEQPEEENTPSITNVVSLNFGSQIQMDNNKQNKDFLHDTMELEDVQNPMDDDWREPWQEHSLKSVQQNESQQLDKSSDNQDIKKVKIENKIEKQKNHSQQIQKIEISKPIEIEQKKIKQSYTNQEKPLQKQVKRVEEQQIDIIGQKTPSLETQFYSLAQEEPFEQPLKQDPKFSGKNLLEIPKISVRTVDEISDQQFPIRQTKSNVLSPRNSYVSNPLLSLSNVNLSQEIANETPTLNPQPGAIKDVIKVVKSEQPSFIDEQQKQQPLQVVSEALNAFEQRLSIINEPIKEQGERVLLLEKSLQQLANNIQEGYQNIFSAIQQYKSKEDIQIPQLKQFEKTINQAAQQAAQLAAQSATKQVTENTSKQFADLLVSYQQDNQQTTKEVAIQAAQQAVKEAMQPEVLKQVSKDVVTEATTAVKSEMIPLVQSVSRELTELRSQLGPKQDQQPTLLLEKFQQIEEQITKSNYQLGFIAEQYEWLVSQKKQKSFLQSPNKDFQQDSSRISLRQPTSSFRPTINKFVPKSPLDLNYLMDDEDVSKNPLFKSNSKLTSKLNSPYEYNSPIPKNTKVRVCHINTMDSRKTNGSSRKYQEYADGFDLQMMTLKTNGVFAAKHLRGNPDFIDSFRRMCFQDSCTLLDTFELLVSTNYETIDLDSAESPQTVVKLTVMYKNQSHLMMNHLVVIINTQKSTDRFYVDPLKVSRPSLAPNEQVRQEFIFQEFDPNQQSLTCAVGYMLGSFKRQFTLQLARPVTRFLIPEPIELEQLEESFIDLKSNLVQSERFNLGRLLTISDIPTVFPWLMKLDNTDSLKQMGGLAKLRFQGKTLQFLVRFQENQANKCVCQVGFIGETNMKLIESILTYLVFAVGQF